MHELQLASLPQLSIRAWFFSTWVKLWCLWCQWEKENHREDDRSMQFKGNVGGKRDKWKLCSKENKDKKKQIGSHFKNIITVLITSLLECLVSINPISPYNRAGVNLKREAGHERTEKKPITVCKWSQKQESIRQVPGRKHYFHIRGN